MAVKYIPYDPEPLEGQAVLDNFRRTLRYKGAEDVKEKLRRGMPYYELEMKEQVGDHPGGNMLIRGECVSACAYLKEQGVKVDLVYIDPPFASGADYAKKVYLRRNPKVAEAIAQAEQELDLEELRAFEEKMYGDVWDKEKYLNWMYENLLAIRSVMSETASIYVHLDWHIGHYVKILLDEIFGEANFLNEIIWIYRERESSLKFYNRKHDSIYFYVMNAGDYTFQPDRIREKYSEVTVAKFKYTDEEGRRYRLRYRDGRSDPSQESEDTYRQYLDEQLGTLPRDWFECPIVNQAANERLDYATQKPEALLERVIKASSEEGMVVADFFGGSGVTAAVAHRLGRNFIHCDVGINSIQTSRDRLRLANASFAVYEVRDGVSLYRNPVQTMESIRKLVPGLYNEPALEPFWQGAVQDSKWGMMPVYVPDLQDYSRLLDKPEMFRILRTAVPELPVEVRKIIVYYVDIEDVGEMERFIAEDDSTTVQVELRDLKELLDDMVAADYAEFTQSSDGGDYRITVERFCSDRVQAKIDEFNQRGMANSLRKSFKPLQLSEEGLEMIEYISVDCASGEGAWHSDHEIKIDRFGYQIVDGAKTKKFWNGTITSKKKPLRVKLRNICGDETVWVLEQDSHGD